MTEPGGTTHPASSTGHPGSGASLLVVRWVTPTLMTSPLATGTSFGRDASATFPLPGNEASRRHAEVRFAGPIPSLRDLESRNGTWVNGKRITERVVGPGDIVRIGEWVGVIVELAAPDEPLDLREIAPGWYGGGALARAVSDAARVARTPLPVIIEGETGTGKEGVAQAIHSWSGRAGPFVAVNCAAIPGAMAEGELFGYRKGAFTGAERSNPGLFRAAHEGTLFLDELLELPLALQAKILRALEAREVLPLGEARPIPIDVRIVCATQDPLANAVADRRFRADLLARLDGLTVRLPPLRARRHDIAPLFSQLLRAESGGATHTLDPRLVEAMLVYDWPMNVRELVQLARRLLAVNGHEPVFKRAMLPERMTAGRASAPPGLPTGPPKSPEDLLFDRLIEALRSTGGTVSHAAARIGISRAKAYRLLEGRPEFDRTTLRNGP